jgi:hypothetical protein
MVGCMPAGVRRLARVAEVAVVVELHVFRRVEPLDLDAARGLEALLPLGVLLQDRVGRLGLPAELVRHAFNMV